VKPLCTVILPTVGRPKYFGAALASVAAQTYRPFNILVSDNAANPPIERAEIEKWAPEANVRLVRRQPQVPMGDHINLCFKEAEGEYVFLMSDDDLIAPGYLEADMECILSESSVGMVVALQTQIDESFFGPIPSSPIGFMTLPGTEYANLWFNGGSACALTIFPMLVSRRQVLECGGFRDYPTASHCDNMVFFQLCLGRKLGLLDGGYYYRVYATSSGLAAPWQELLVAQSNYERDLLDMHKQGRLERKLLLAILRSNTQLLFGRWKQLYRHRPGFENRVRPLLDITLRLFSMGWQHGFGSLPKLHKWSGIK
jgi:glycosyltransferase involved in cell wall biosynthesis